MRFNAACLLLNCLLASSVSALPDLKERALPACAKDACGRAVFQGSTSVRKQECSSYLKKTVSPCPITRTQTNTKTSTAQPVVKTTTATVVFGTTTVTSTVVQSTPSTVTATRDVTDNRLVTTTSTVHETVTRTNVAHVTVPAVQTVTDTTTATTTETITAQPNEAQVARDESNAFPIQELEERQNPKCPSTRSASRIPARASACPRAAAYSSACSCLGVRSARTTLRASTVTSTKQITTTTTPTNTVTAINQVRATRTVTITTNKAVPTTVTTTRAVTKESTQVVTTTSGTSTKFESTTLTDTVTATTHATTTITSTKTVTVTARSTPTSNPTPQNCFRARIAPQSIRGGYYFGLDPNGAIRFQASPSDANILYIGSGSLLREVTDRFMVIEDTAMSVMYLDSETDVQPSRHRTMQCAVTQAGALECTSENGNNKFWICEENFPSFGNESAAPMRGCTELEVLAESMSSCPSPA